VVQRALPTLCATRIKKQQLRLQQSCTAFKLQSEICYIVYCLAGHCRLLQSDPINGRLTRAARTQLNLTAPAGPRRCTVPRARSTFNGSIVPRRRARGRSRSPAHPGLQDFRGSGPVTSSELTGCSANEGARLSCQLGVIRMRPFPVKNRYIFAENRENHCRMGRFPLYMIGPHA
jgi:hypothetical protein